MTLERLFQPGAFDVRTFGPARWPNEGNGYTTLEDSPGETGGRTIVFYRTEKEDRPASGPNNGPSPIVW